MVQVHNAVKIKAGKYRGLVGVVEEVGDGYVVVKVEGVREGVGFSDTVRLAESAVEVRQ